MAGGWLVASEQEVCFVNFFFPMAQQPLVGRSLIVESSRSLRRTTVGRTPLDEWSARRRDLYLTTHNTHNRQTSMAQVGFEPAIPGSERPQSPALDRAVPGIGISCHFSELWQTLKLKPRLIKTNYMTNWSVGIATRYGLDGLGFESQCGRDFSHPSIPALGPTQPPMQWPPSLSPGGGKAAGAWRWSPTPFWRRGQRTSRAVHLPASEASWPVVGVNLHRDRHVLLKRSM